MPLPVGSLAPNFVLQEINNGSQGPHPYRQQSERPKFRLWEDFTGKPKLLVFIRPFPSYPFEEFFAFLNENYSKFSDWAHIITVINAGSATSVDSSYRNGGYTMPFYCCFTDDLRKYQQLHPLGNTQPIPGVYLIEGGNEPKILDYIEIVQFSEELNQRIIQSIEPKTAQPAQESLNSVAQLVQLAQLTQQVEV